MSEPDLQSMKAIQTKLQNLVACVVAKAAEDPAFAAELEEVLLSDSLKKKLANPSARSKRHHFSPVTILHTKGEAGLRADMELLTDDELRRVSRAQGLFKGRDVKTILRTELVSEIISSAQRRLTQGESFLKNP